MIYVDSPSPRSNGKGLWSHMTGDSAEELHSFAQALGVKRCWYHRGHYDLKGAQFGEAVSAGALVKTPREMTVLRRKLWKRKKRASS